MSRLLEDLRIVEHSAFVAAPLGGMTLAQLGAEVIRIDPIGGGIDFRRWPVAANGMSLYWAGLNKEKRSVALALDRPEGRELARAIITAPGPGGGIVLSNLPPLPGLDFASLEAARGDLIMLRLVGNRDGTAAVDYTVNAASGFPLVTGPGGGPVNHVLPAWDIAAGLYLAAGLLAAERHRARTGAGQEVVAALADVMLAAVGNLGYVGDVQINGRARPALGNDLYGSFGRDFATADGRRVMVIALTPRQWQALARATGLGERGDDLLPFPAAAAVALGGEQRGREVKPGGDIPGRQDVVDRSAARPGDQRKAARRVDRVVDRGAAVAIADQPQHDHVGACCLEARVIEAG